ncbi:GpE family phage tail protein [Sphingomonas sp.]
MADLAVVFHWSPAVMDGMALPELMAWRRRAAARVNPKEQADG